MRRSVTSIVRSASLVSIVLSMCLVGSSRGSLAQATTPSESVVAMLNITAPSTVRDVFGSGFLISPDGTVLTNAHVVLAAQRDPAHYQLIALWHGEWFAASVVCISLSGADQDRNLAQTVRPHRDVAEARLLPAPVARVIEVQGRRWVPHTGPLPSFPALTFAVRDPAAGQQVETSAYGFIGMPPTLITTRGRVIGLFAAPDGTPVVDVRYAAPVERGESGAPILDSYGNIVAMQTWGSASTPNEGAGIAQSALRTPCR